MGATDNEILRPSIPLGIGPLISQETLLGSFRIESTLKTINSLPSYNAAVIVVNKYFEKKIKKTAARIRQAKDKFDALHAEEVVEKINKLPTITESYVSKANHLKEALNELEEVYEETGQVRIQAITASDVDKAIEDAKYLGEVLDDLETSDRSIVQDLVGIGEIALSMLSYTGCAQQHRNPNGRQYYNNMVDSYNNLQKLLSGMPGRGTEITNKGREKRQTADTIISNLREAVRDFAEGLHKASLSYEESADALDSAYQRVSTQFDNIQAALVRQCHLSANTPLLGAIDAALTFYEEQKKEAAKSGEKTNLEIFLRTKINTIKLIPEGVRKTKVLRIINKEFSFEYLREVEVDEIASKFLSYKL